MATCLVVGADSRKRSCIVGCARLEKLAGVEIVTVWHDSLQEFCDALAATPNAFGLITDGGDLRAGRESLQEVFSERPDIDVFLYGRPQHLPATSGGVAWLVPDRILASGVMEAEVEGPGRLRDVLVRGYGSRFTRRFLNELKLRSPAAGVIADRLIRETAWDAYSVARWADDDGVSVRTLERQVGRTSASPPQTLVSLAALYNVARLRLYGYRRAADVAEAVGFQTGSSIRRIIQRYLPVKPQSFWGREGLELAGRRLADALLSPARRGGPPL
jgi:AraC-like DNA-binding protein